MTQHAGQLLPQILEQSRSIRTTRQQGQAEVEVAGDSLGKPEAFGDHRLPVVVGAKLNGPQPPHIPLVQVFMADQLQQLPVTLGLGQSRPTELKHSTVVVFQAAIALIEQLQHQLVAVPRWRRGSQQATGGTAHLLDVADEVRRPTHRRRANQQQLMALALHREGFCLKWPRMQRTVHEGIEIGSDPALSAGLQGQMHTPVLRSRDGNVVW